MTAGSIGAWQKKAGDALQPGDVLVEIETDKAQMDFEFQDEGVLAKILRDSGERDIAVGKVSIRYMSWKNMTSPDSSFSTALLASSCPFPVCCSAKSLSDNRNFFFPS